jgi:hypothetical protein
MKFCTWSDRVRNPHCLAATWVILHNDIVMPLDRCQTPHLHMDHQAQVILMLLVPLAMVKGKCGECARNCTLLPFPNFFFTEEIVWWHRTSAFFSGVVYHNWNWKTWTWSYSSTVNSPHRSLEVLHNQDEMLNDSCSRPVARPPSSVYGALWRTLWKLNDPWTFTTCWQRWSLSRQKCWKTLWENLISHYELCCVHQGRKGIKPKTA